MRKLTFLLVFVCLSAIGTAQVYTPLQVPADNYAFQYDAQQNFGLYFSLAYQRYEFRDGTAAPVFWTGAQNGNTFIKGRLGINDPNPAASLVVNNGSAHFGIVGSFAKFDEDGDLFFNGASDYLVGTNKFAFRFRQNELYGLYFNSTDNAYQFLNGVDDGSGKGTAVFSINSQSGNVGIGTMPSSTYSLFVNGTARMGKNFEYVDVASYGGGLRVLDGGNSSYFVRMQANTGGPFYKAELQLNNPSGSVTLSTPRIDFATDPDTSTLSTSGDLWIQNGGTNTMSLTQSGNVGIGTSAPNASLDIFGNGDGNYIGGYPALIRLQTPNENPFSFVLSNQTATDARDYGIWLSNSGSLAFSNLKDGFFNTVMVMDSSGNVGVGTPFPSENLDINGNIRVRGLPANDTLDRIVVADPSGVLHTRDAATLGGGGGGLWSATGSDIYYTAGKVGIGTNNPLYDMHVIGTKITLQNTGQGNGTAYMDFESSTAGGSELTVGIVGGSGDGIVYHRNNQPLHFGTNDQLRMTISAGGNVGIGTQNPGYKLSVQTSGDSYGISHSNGVSELGTYLNSAGAWLGTITLNKSLFFFTNNSSAKMTITAAGNVGIGTSTPQSELAVNGKITCKEVNVTLTGFPDYVFNEDYDLRPLDEVESFIKENKHLPEVPSEKEVLNGGLDLGQMNAILLQKVEELTLYTIEQAKQIEALKTAVEQLKD